MTHCTHCNKELTTRTYERESYCTSPTCPLKGLLQVGIENMPTCKCGTGKIMGAQGGCRICSPITRGAYSEERQSLLASQKQPVIEKQNRCCSCIPASEQKGGQGRNGACGCYCHN